MQATRRIAVAFLAFMLALGLFAISPRPAQAAAAVNMQEGTPTCTLGTASDTPTVVDFGGHEWIAIGQSGNMLTLLSKSGGAGGGFGTTVYTPNSVYESSSLYDKMLSIYNGSNSPFTDVERNRILPATLDGIMDDTYDRNAALADQYVWPLSVEEAESLHSNTVRSFADDWWLRTPGTSANYATYVGSDGTVNGDPGTQLNLNDSYAVRPAFNLNLSSVLFTSHATLNSGKYQSAPGSGLQTVAAPDGSAPIKFTFTDSTMATPALTLGGTTNGTDAIHFGYAGATTGTNQYLSCVLEQSGAVKYYGKLAYCTSSSNASGIFILPVPYVAAGIYDLKIFCEQANDITYSDFAGASVGTMTLTVAGSDSGDNTGSVSGTGFTTDNTAPTLTAGAVSRTSNTNATVKFTSSEAGQYFWGLDNTTLAPDLIPMTASEQTITFANLTAGEHILSVLALDLAGNSNQADPLIITIPAYAPSGGRGGGSSAAATTIPAGDGSVSVSFTQTGGTVSLNLPDSKVTEIIGKARDGMAVFDLSKLSGATQATLPKTALTQLANAGLGVGIKLPQGTLTLSAEAAQAVATQANGADVSVELKQLKVSDLNPAQRSAVQGSDLIVDINIHSGSQKITDLGGALTVTMPYNGPLPPAVWYLNDAGELEKLDCTYDAATKTVTFTTTHLSVYVVRQGELTPLTPTMPVNPFADVTGSDWFIDDVIYAYSNGLMNGISTDPPLFSPQATTTRGMIVTILWRMAGSPSDRIPAAAGGGQFSDVGVDAYYYQAVNWAAANGLVSGIGNGKFAPEGNITREQLAVILYRYAVLEGKGPQGAWAIWMNFTDVSSISDWAGTGMMFCYLKGVISGYPDGSLKPQGETTRAEAAAMLHKFIDATAE